MKRNVAASAAIPKRRSSRNMKATRQPKTAARSLARSISSGGLQWPPVEVPRRFRALSVATTLPRCQSVKPHAVLGVNVVTKPRGSVGLRPRRPVPFPLSRVPSPHLLGVLVQVALGTAVGTTPVGTPVRTLVTKIQRSDCSAFTAVNSTPSTLIQRQGSEVSDVAAANTQLLQQNAKLHPVLGIFVPTRRRAASARVPELLSLFPGGNCDN